MTLDRGSASTGTPLTPFPVGSTVQCTTVHGNTVEGEVMASDLPLKLLALKKTEGGRCSVIMVNLEFTTSCQIVRDANAMSSVQILPKIDIDKLDSRIKNEMTKKSRTISSANVSLEARKLFCAINKAYDDVAWHKADIVVLKKVVITSPYTPDNVKLIEPSKDSRCQQAKQRIRMMVERHCNKNAESSQSQHGDDQPLEGDDFLAFHAQITQSPEPEGDDIGNCQPCEQSMQHD